MTSRNLWDGAKAVLRGKFIAIQSNLKKQEKRLVDNLTLYVKQMEKEQRNSKTSRKKKIIKIQAEINEKGEFTIDNAETQKDYKRLL